MSRPRSATGPPPPSYQPAPQPASFAFPSAAGVPPRPAARAPAPPGGRGVPLPNPPRVPPPAPPPGTGLFDEQAKPPRPGCWAATAPGNQEHHARATGHAAPADPADPQHQGPVEQAVP